MEQLRRELAACAESLAFRRRLAKIDPSNAQWRHDEACSPGAYGTQRIAPKGSALPPPGNDPLTMC